MKTTSSAARLKVYAFKLKNFLYVFCALGLQKKHGSLTFILGFLLTASFLATVQAAATTGFPDLTTKRYKQASAYYHNLLLQPQKSTSQQNWKEGAENFLTIFKQAPNHHKAAASLFMAAKLYEQMALRFRQPSCFDQAVHSYEQTGSYFPGHVLADDALFAAGQIYIHKLHEPEKAAALFAKIVTLFPHGDMAVRAARELTKNKKRGSFSSKKRSLATRQGKEQISRIRHWSTRNYTRVVLETSGPVRFKKNFSQTTSSSPGRFYVNLFNCRIAREHQDPIPIRDGLLKQVRSVQFSADMVQVVLDTAVAGSYKVFSLDDPFRVVIDVTGKAITSKALPTLAEQLGLEVKTVVIDPGHGGKDPGAVSLSGLLEKNVVLKVAKKVAALLKNKANFNVILTRNRDVYIPLEERTAIANAGSADLFVSIHVNAAPNCKAKGVETYFLSLATSEDEMRAAARENAASARQLSDLQAILTDLMQNSKIEESANLASSVQEQMTKGLCNKYQTRDLGVKKAPFIVLIGARMPAILTEIGFISNPVEEKRLRNEGYLDDIAKQITAGILLYSKKGLVASL